MSITHLKQKAKIIRKIRQFFDDRDVLEVSTPLLRLAPVTDPYLETFSVKHNGEDLYLQTSPEYAMKVLLSQGSGSIYQVCKAFRVDEVGRLHNHEFTMLEWYRVGFDEHQLMGEMDDFLQMVLDVAPAERVTYQSLFEKYLHINPHNVENKILTELLHKNCGEIFGLIDPSNDDCLQILMSDIIEPKIGKDRPVFVYDYPVSQSALAKKKQTDNQMVASRFEVYFKGIELANGYHELTDHVEQEKRFNEDIKKRVEIDAKQVPIDKELLGAMENGLPDCAGVALGLDRLLMLALGLNEINH
jgi:lysyl-tRNA synthetase class 2